MVIYNIIVNYSKELNYFKINYKHDSSVLIGYNFIGIFKLILIFSTRQTRNLVWAY